jgi:hypothetical protein
MKKTTKATRKLELNRETLRALDAGDLQAARPAGGTVGDSNCLTRCLTVDTCTHNGTCDC